jgi:integrase/recombinase XerD
VTRLRKMMLEELQRRNYSPATIRQYLYTVTDFTRYFGRSPDKLGPDQLRTFQAHLLSERKLAVGTVVARVAALRFFFVRVLKRYEFKQDIPYPKHRWRRPIVLSKEEVARLINAAGNLFQRTLLMIVYGTGMRRSEMSKLRVQDIDSARMVIHVEFGKGGTTRDIPLSPALLETLREYWRWKKPKTFLFVGSRGCPHISDKTVYHACSVVAHRAGITKKVTPHLLRHSLATHMLEDGNALEKIQAVLGHGDLRTTARYLHLSQHHLHAIVNPLDSLDLEPVQGVGKCRRPPKK